MAQSWLPGAAAEKVRLLEQNGMPLEQRKAAEDITAKVNTASEMVTFNRRTNKRDEEFLGGKSPYEGTLGPNKSSDLFSAYAGQLRKTNPRHDF